MHQWVQKLTRGAGGIQGHNINLHLIVAITPCAWSSAAGHAAAALGRLPSLHELPARGTAPCQAQQASLLLISIVQVLADA